MRLKSRLFAADSLGMSTTATPEILLADDNPADVDLIREVLTASTRTTHLHMVADGEAAIAFLRGKGKFAGSPRPDLMILDLNLPRKDGRAVLAEIKRDANLHTLPVVVFTTSQSTHDMNHCYELGAIRYVSKPGNWRDFTLAVRSIEEFWFAFASQVY